MEMGLNAMEMVRQGRGSLVENGHVYICSQRLTR
jgi:hypothetical protein